VRGPESAPVTVVLFSDFECPYCKRIEPTIDALTRAYPGKVRVVWKHFPLPFHANARPAAAAAMAAAAQGKFWVMHDKLIGEQARLDRASLDGYARELGLDPARFGSGMTQGYDGVVDADIKQGTELGVTGTPTVFINGRKLVGARPLSDFKAVVDEELAKGG
jgi:protein-disulfide isomerase